MNRPRVTDPRALGPLADRILDQLETVIVGKRDMLRLVLAAVFADGHVLLEDVPGVAKTATARAIAETCGLEFSRIQFTPDLIPADITGATVYDPARSSTEFRPGPVFANLVLGDEINRAPPKTQSALLEAMEERQVTVDGATRPLPDAFIVIGTQNPIEAEGTYPLPEAQLDRFLIRTGIGYPAVDAEVDLVIRRAHRGTDRVHLEPVLGADDTRSIQLAVELVHVSEPVARYLVDIVDGTRQSPRVEVGASPRGSLALLKMARSWAAIGGRNYVLPDDVKAMAVPALSHRLLLMPDQWVRGIQPFEVITEILDMIPAPQPMDVGEEPGSVPDQLSFGDAPR